LNEDNDGTGLLAMTGGAAAAVDSGLTDIDDLVSEKLREVAGSLFRHRLLLRWLKHAVDRVPLLTRVAYLVVDQNAVNFCCSSYYGGLM